MKLWLAWVNIIANRYRFVYNSCMMLIMVKEAYLVRMDVPDDD